MGGVGSAVDGHLEGALDHIVDLLVGELPVKAGVLDHQKARADVGLVLVHQLLEISSCIGVAGVKHIHLHGVAANDLQAVGMALLLEGFCIQ